MPLIAELQRRNVFRVAAAYLALGWVVSQVTSLMIPALHLPESVLSIVVWIGVVGFPFVVVFAWAFEITPEGLKRDREVDRTQSITHVTGRKLDYITIGFVVIAVALFAFDRIAPRGTTQAQDSRAEARPTTSPGASADEEVGRASARQEPTPAALPAPDEKSIAVLPFVNMSSDKEQEYFSDGISEELLNLLAKIPELKVIARTSSFAFKGEKMEMVEIAKRLNVAHVLEGSVRKSGNTVRITAQLIRAMDSTHLWSETYDRPLDNIFAVQDEIAGAVVSQLKIKLLGAVPTAKPVDPRVYPQVLQAKALGDLGSAAGNAQAVELYQQILAIAPDESRAWSGLGRIYFNQAINGQRPPVETGRLAHDALEKALALDPDDAVTHTRLGGVLTAIDNDVAAAADHYRRALVLDAGNVAVINNVANYLKQLGRLDEALALNIYQAGHDPANAITQFNLGYAYYATGHLDEAIATLRRALSLSPQATYAHTALGQALLLKGEPAAALTEMQAEPDEASRLQGIVLVQDALGQRAESDAPLQALIARFATEQAASIALVYARRNEPDKAFEWLDRSIANHEPIGWVINEPMFKPLFDDPRWPAFLRKIGRAPEQLAAIKFDVKLPQ